MARVAERNPILVYLMKEGSGGSDDPRMNTEKKAASKEQGRRMKR